MNKTIFIFILIYLLTFVYYFRRILILIIRVLQIKEVLRFLEEKKKFEVKSVTKLIKIIYSKLRRIEMECRKKKWVKNITFTFSFD